MALNLNVSPYYDDFDDAKNFHRILFKPGYAVQARELTQLQTILQSQVGKFGNHVFKNGAVISGCEESLDNKRPYVKIIDTDASAAAVSNAVLEDYVGDTITGGTSGVKAVILSALTGATGSAPNLKTFYLRYISRSDF